MSITYDENLLDESSEDSGFGSDCDEGDDSGTADETEELE